MILISQYSETGKKSGFALLMSLIVVGVLISIGLTVLNLTISQVRLSTTAGDSEIAFHAANAGVECGLYTRRTNAVDMETGGEVEVNCFTASSFTTIEEGVTASVSNGGTAYLYDYEISWGQADEGDLDRCSRIKTLVAVADTNDMTISDVSNDIPGYPGENDELECEVGERCTVMSVRGYNQPCGQIDSFGTVEREVLLQF